MRPYLSANWSQKAMRGAGGREAEGSQSRIDGLAFESQHPEDTLVDPAQRLTANKALQRLEPQ